MWIRAAVLAIALAPTAALAQQVTFTVPEVRVNMAPPPMRVEVQSARPSPGHIWIAGHWAWRGGAHVWISGHWAMPPQPGMVWEPARWNNRGGQWGFQEGHWRWAAPPQQTVVYEEQAPVQEVVVAQAPPAPIVEVRPAAPFGGAVWIPGYWHWNGGNHVWVGGRWSAGRPGMRWEPNHWVRGPGGWRMEHGRWR